MDTSVDLTEITTGVIVKCIANHFGLIDILDTPGKLEELSVKLENHLNDFPKADHGVRLARLRYIRNIIFNNHKNDCYCGQQFIYNPKGASHTVYPHGKCLNCYRIEVGLIYLFVGATFLTSLAQRQR